MVLSRVRMQFGLRSAFPGIVLFLLLAFFLSTPSTASAATVSAGGACPSGASYLNTSTNTLVSLASLGVNQCYYIAANGSDNNSGTTEASPWLHAPQMPACSANCATVQNQSGGIPAGTGLILRGGDTWHFGNSSNSPYTGGTWNFNVSPYPMGTSSNPIYVGVDPTWYSGSSWARPILTGDNPTCDSGNAGNGGCNSGTMTCTASNCPGEYYVNSCSYQISSSNNMLDISGLQYYTIDNLEMTGLCENHTISGGGQEVQGDDTYLRYGSLRAPSTFQNLYIHGWTHTQFAGANGGPNCTTGVVCFNIFAFQGSVINGSIGETLAYDVVDGEDADPIGGGVCYGGMYDVAYSAFRYTSQCIGATHSFHDNLYEYFYENGHSNMFEEVNGLSGTNAIYNNVFRHVENGCSSGCGVGLWFYPPAGTTDYFFNNLYYDEGSIELWIIGQNNQNAGTAVMFNNTVEFSSSGAQITGSATHNSVTLKSINNHFITDNSNGPIQTSTFTSATETTDLKMNHSTATTDGYASSQNYAYSPTSASSPTVGAGTNENGSNGAFCSALTSAGLSDAANVCQSDTRYACSYDSANHAVTCPSRTPNARPATAWAVGAYEFNTQDPPPAPPTGLAAAVQ